MLPTGYRVRLQQALLAGRVLLCALLTLGLSGCWASSATQNRPTGVPTLKRLPVQNASVHYWFANNDLLFVENERLFRYSPTTNKRMPLAPSVITPDQSVVLPLCATEVGGAVSVMPTVALHPPPPKKRSAGSPAAYVDYSLTEIWLVEDWQHPEKAQHVKNLPYWAINPLDCQLRVNAKTFKPDLPKLPASHPLAHGVPEQNSTSLLPSTMGQTTVYATEPTAPWTVLLTQKNAIRKRWDIALESQARIGYASYLQPVLDRKQQAVVWLTRQSFNADPKQWSLSAWRIALETLTMTPLSLPAGPWVYPHDFLKQLSCFSCGCSCYEQLAFAQENGQLVVHVSGKAVEEKHQGLYRLVSVSEHPGEPAKSRWLPWVKGPIDNDFALAPDGCRVAYTRQGDLYVADRCANEAR